MKVFKLKKSIANRDGDGLGTIIASMFFIVIVVALAAGPILHMTTNVSSNIDSSSNNVQLLTNSTTQ
jgi:hypothetical protein